jgi:hypothetical protein
MVSMNAKAALNRHHAEFARAAAAAMQKHYQETIDICSDLLTSGIYDEIAAADLKGDAARQHRAETRLLMATAMHYNESHYEDILRVLNAALDSPLQIQKDVNFTLAVLHTSFDHVEEARTAMEKSLEQIAQVRASGGQTLSKDEIRALDAQEQEATQFLNQLGTASAKHDVQ